jgi:hypothetical protein
MMAKKSSRRRPEAPKKVEPAWDKATWMSLANVRLGIPAFVVAGALHAKPANAKVTEAEVRRLVSDFLNQSL